MEKVNNEINVCEKFIKDLGDSKEIIFIKPDGTTFRLRGVKKYGNHSYKRFGAASIVFKKGDYSEVMLGSILDDYNLNDFKYEVVESTLSNKTLEITNGEGNKTTLLISYHQGERKHFGNNILMELTNLLDKERTYRLSDGRIAIGTNVTEFYDEPLVRYIKSVCVPRYIKTSPIQAINKCESVAFIMNHDNSVDLGFIDSQTGDYLAWITDVTKDLTKECKQKLHIYKEQYVETLTNVEKVLDRALNEGRV